MPLLRSRGRKSLATSDFAGAYPARQGIYTLSPETALPLRNKSTAKGVIYYGSFPGGTKQGLHRNEQPPPTQQGAFLKGNCILLDDGDECVCPQLISYSLLCKWFRVAVLPADRLLYAELYQTGDKKKCTECGAFFASTSNSVKYCPVCRKRITRRQAAERMRKRRAPVTQ
ncbi:hypothetical protein N510_000413 [Firmicutes bacterium ASF500]|nr:hypothetical protein N510_000413 [Firmicutes bacterium ASF500]